MEGWIKIWRQFVTWEWYSDVNARIVFIHLLLKVNHETRIWQKSEIKRGSCITSLAKLSTEVGISVNKLRDTLTKLKSTGEITTESTNNYTIISICNYDTYQSDEPLKHKPKHKPKHEQSTSQSTSQSTTTKEGKKEELKNNKYNMIPPDFESIKLRMEERGILAFTPDAFFAHYTSNGWMVGKNKMKNWDAALTYWKTNHKANQKTYNGSTQQNNTRNIKRVNSHWN